MLVIIDVISEGHYHFIDTDPDNWVKVEHPDGSGPTTIDQMLRHHAGNPDAREKGGWHIKNQLPGETEPMTRWQRLVRACNHPDAHPQAKALGLHE